MDADPAPRAAKPATAIRPAIPADLPGVLAILNHYIEHSTANFKTVPLTEEEATAWFAGFGPRGRHRLLVAERTPTKPGAPDGSTLGFACTQRFLPRAAYDTTVMSTVYLDPSATGKGLGSALYTALFDSIAVEDIHRVIAGITLPNPGSVALHRRFGFRDVGILNEAGRKFDRFWDVAWMQRPLALDG